MISIKIKWESFFAISMLGLLAFYLLNLIVPLRWEDLYQVYGITIICALAGIYFAKRGLKGSLELKLYLAFVVWMLLSRWINGDIYPFIDFGSVVKTLTLFLFLATGTLLGKESRSKYFDALCLIYIAFYLIVASIGIFIFLTDTYLHIPPENIWFTIIQENSLLALNALSSHRLVTAVRLLVAWCLVICQLFRRKSIAWRIPLTVGLIVFHVAIGLCHGRTTFITLSCCLAMTMVLLLLPYFRKHKLVIQFTALPIAAVMVLLLCYKSFDISNKTIVMLRTATVPAFEEFYQEHRSLFDEEHFGTRFTASNIDTISEETTANAELAENVAYANPQPVNSAQPSEASIVDSRKLAGNWTLTGRTDIWKSGLIAIRENPSRALTGSLSTNIMPLVNQIYHERIAPSDPEEKSHMHSTFMQVLMETGIPGLFLALAILASLVIKIIKLYFRQDGYSNLHVKVLTIPITGLIIASLVEPYLFISSDSCALAVMICIGLFLAEYSEIYNSK